MAFSITFLKSSALFLTILSVFIFFILFTPNPSPESPSRRSLTATGDSNSSFSPTPSCSSVESHSDGLINYLYFHFCFFDENPSLSVPFLTLFLLLHFYILIKTAQDHFSIVTSKLAFHLNLSPSMAAVTLLALGNGAPDVFASVAAVRGGQYRTGFGAILSAGTFVSAFVVGFVAIYAAPFSVNPAQFVRDVLFYLTAALFLFYVYLSAEIFLWQAVGFVGFYLFFVGFVFWMDLRMGSGKAKSGGDLGVTKEADVYHGELPKDCEIGEGYRNVDEGKTNSGFWEALRIIRKAWEAPVSFLLKLTIPQPAPSEWSRLYASANISLCPVALLYASFVMSVFWISTIAGELLNCLAVLGVLLKLPPALLGLTVLAWGNSVGDLVADVALAKAGQPLLAMAGCFAGPMFNMLVGLGTALVIQTANSYPDAYQLQFHIGIVIAFVFLLFSLMGSLLVIIWCRFRVPRFWGFCLVLLYIVFMAASLLMAKFSP
ncbi:cation/calcium exchanger 5 isoform X2 [Cucumis melo]|uniref:Cation/calcium exchanger 5 isoform X2 n=1 Tax=Cucumis melo TaxID=3656 RepID=A0ABM3KHG7_CUCME|nr:cation/calcium exchanger 5 isoform X2 [Cucumis melo]